MGGMAEERFHERQRFGGKLGAPATATSFEVPQESRIVRLQFSNSKFPDVSEKEICTL